MTKQKSVSIIVPIYNEAESLAELYRLIKKAVEGENRLSKYEIIFINDGSTDDTLNILKSFQTKNLNVHIISFRRNLGKAVALNQGFKKSTGELIITLDADLQDGSENIPALIDKLDEEYDLVIGWKKKRFDPISKTLPSWTFNLFVRSFSRIPLHDFNCGLKVMRAIVAKEIFLYGELHRFVPVLAVQQGFRVAEVAVIHHPRKYGKSKYGRSRVIAGFYDFLTVMFLGTYKERPLHLFGLFGSALVTLGLLMGGYFAFLTITGNDTNIRSLLILSAIAVVAGLQMFLSGLIAEMIISNRTNPTKNIPIDYEV